MLSPKIIDPLKEPTDKQEKGTIFKGNSSAPPQLGVESQTEVEGRVCPGRQAQEEAEVSGTGKSKIGATLLIPFCPHSSGEKVSLFPWEADTCAILPKTKGAGGSSWRGCGELG